MSLTTTGVAVKKNHMKYNGIEFFRGNASMVRLGSHGPKRTPVFDANFLDPQGHISPKHFDVIKATTVSIDFSQSSATDITLDVRPMQLKFAGGEVSATRKLASQGELKLIQLAVEPGDLMRYINSTPSLRDQLAHADNDLRVVTQVWVVAKTVLADRVDTSVAGSVQATVNGITVGLKGGQNGSSETSLDVEPGTIFAYALGDLEWDKAAKNKRTRVTGIRLDKWGIG
jgi:hypothetical protein